ncbi:hypothetical protein [Cellulosimicrobium cellulans]|uniref:hypothetical protein n=1 Tax=Cellulosimicrobium cellulans TaxID=1710 RepID=UPI0037F315C0
MSNTHGNGIADTPEDELIVINAALVALGAIAGSAGFLWLKGVAWLIEHNILVAASAEPLLVLPASDGAGLDLPRIAIAGGVLLGVVVLSVSAAVRAISRLRRREHLA